MTIYYIFINFIYIKWYNSQSFSNKINSKISEQLVTCSAVLCSFGIFVFKDSHVFTCFVSVLIYCRDKNRKNINII
jgi:hypothetical protein